MVVLTLVLGAVSAIDVRPAHAAAGIVLDLPVPVGEYVRANGPHSDGPGGTTGVFNAVDIGPNDGTSMTVHAAATGTVGSVDPNCKVRIQHANGWATQYMHVKYISVSVGQYVSAGDAIGYAGTPAETCGQGDGRHVHFSLYLNGSPYAINGTSVGGYTVHAGSEARDGWWTDDDTGVTVVNSTGLMVPGMYNDTQPISTEWRESGHSVVSDGSGRVWSFAIKQDGTLMYRFTDSSGWINTWRTVGSGYRSVAASLDGTGRVLMAYITDDGVLRYRRTYTAPTDSDEGGGFGPSSDPMGAGSWANVSVALDGHKRVWLAATKTGGRAYYKHQDGVDGAWPAGFTEFGNDGWQSISVAAEPGNDGRAWLFGTKSDGGDLWYRHTNAGMTGWDPMTLVGSGWDGDVSATSDRLGRMWMFGVQNGTLKYRHTDGSGWGPYTAVSGSGWASVSSGMKASTKTGVIWMFATKTNGDLSYRHTDTSADNWTDFAAVDGGPWK